MAFTEAQKVLIRRYLEFPLGYYSESPLEGMMDKVGGIAVEQASVETTLASLALVETAIATSGTSSSVTGALKEIVGDVGWYSPMESGGVTTNRDYGRALLNRLAVAFLGSDHECALGYFSGARGRDGEMALG